MVSKKREFDRGLLLVALALAGIGLVMVYSSSTMWAESNRLGSSFLLMRQSIRVFIGVTLMLAFMHIDYHVLGRRAGLFLAVALLLLGAVLVVRYTIRGASRSLPLPFLGGSVSSFQPAELARLALIIYLADVLAKRQRVIRTFWYGLVPHAVVIAIAAALIMLQPDVGTALATTLAAGILLFVANVRVSHLAVTSATCLPFVGWYVLSAPYRRLRLIGFLHPNQYTDSINYQINQAFIAFSKGGLLGLGLGQSRQKLLFLPEPFTDFIFPIIGEEFGVLGALVILALFLMFVWKAIQIARWAPDLLGFLLGAGIASMIGTHGAINLAVAMGLLPTTGLALPFVSYGGSGLMVTLVSTGILLSISRQASAAGFWAGRLARSGHTGRGLVS